eukprot:3430564-Pyramimonas_sp.AAC.1
MRQIASAEAGPPSQDSWNFSQLCRARKEIGSSDFYSGNRWASPWYIRTALDTDALSTKHMWPSSAARVMSRSAAVAKGSRLRRTFTRKGSTSSM